MRNTDSTVYMYWKKKTNHRRRFFSTILKIAGRKELYRERKTVGDFKNAANIQSEELPCHESWRELLAMLYYLQCSLTFHKAVKKLYYKGCITHPGRPKDPEELQVSCPLAR
jgi:spore maturation protein CgeB